VLPRCGSSSTTTTTTMAKAETTISVAKKPAVG